MFNASCEVWLDQGTQNQADIHNMRLSVTASVVTDSCEYSNLYKKLGHKDCFCILSYVFSVYVWCSRLHPGFYTC